MALTGYNGDNETNIGLSRSIKYSLYDENMNKISVRNLLKPIDLWIARDTSVLIEPFKYINATSLNSTLNVTNGTETIMDGTFTSGFQLNGTNVSIHIQIKSENNSQAYLSLLKFGDNPTLENNFFDILNIFCPKSDLRNEGNDSFYLTFLNMSQVNSFKGYVGYSLIELDPTELDCSNKSVNHTLLKLQLKQNRTSNFSSNFWLRSFSSGCYYMNKTLNKWSSNGMEILSDTNTTHTHCQSNHLTTFAGGFIVLPNAINFSYVWSHSSFTQNLVIYCAVIVVVTIYVLLCVWCRFMDWMDKKKFGITLLENRNFISLTNRYFYEIIVFTGARINAGTKSKVNIFVYNCLIFKKAFHKTFDTKLFKHVRKIKILD
jgi:hypothetical protein